MNVYLLRCKTTCIIHVHQFQASNGHVFLFIYSNLAFFIGLNTLPSQRCSSKTFRIIIIPQEHWAILPISPWNSPVYNPGWTHELNLVKKSVSLVGRWIGGPSLGIANVERRLKGVCPMSEVSSESTTSVGMYMSLVSNCMIYTHLGPHMFALTASYSQALHGST